MEREIVEKKILEAQRELMRLSPLYKEVEKSLREVSKEIDHWANIKYEAEKKLVKVQRLSSIECSVKRTIKPKKNPTVTELLTSLSNISLLDKEKLLAALTP